MTISRYHPDGQIIERQSPVDVWSLSMPIIYEERGIWDERPSPWRQGRASRRAQQVLFIDSSARSIQTYRYTLHRTRFSWNEADTLRNAMVITHLIVLTRYFHLDNWVQMAQVEGFIDKIFACD